jgi:hypothetical protein
VYVPDDIIPDEHRASGATAGFHFGVIRMQGDNFDPTRHYADISNGSQLPAAGIQLAWLYIKDQNHRNQFIEHGRDEDTGVPVKRFRLIDLAAMFSTSKWTIETLANLPMEYKLPDHLAEHLTMQQLEPVMAALKAQPNSEIEDCFLDCPNEWGISDEDKRAAIARTLNARDQIEQIIRVGNPNLK